MSSSGSRASVRGRETLSLTAGSPSTDVASSCRSSGSFSPAVVVATTLIDSPHHWPRPHATSAPFSAALLAGVEQIHERRAEQRVRARVAEQVGPCLVRVDEDAFLNVRDRVDGARHERLELFLVLIRREQRLVERALEPKRAQLALGDAAQALGLAERDEILRAGEQRLGDVGFLRGLADDDERHGARGLLLDLGDLADRRRQAVREEAQELRRMVVDRARERVDLRDPVATDRVAAIAQRAVDELDVVFATAEHDERYRGLRHAVSCSRAKGAV